jgi:hypothetical protein
LRFRGLASRLNRAHPRFSHIHPGRSPFDLNDKAGLARNDGVAVFQSLFRGGFAVDRRSVDAAQVPKQARSGSQLQREVQARHVSVLGHDDIRRLGAPNLVHVAISQKELAWSGGVNLELYAHDAKNPAAICVETSVIAEPRCAT